ncbi:hypothetical protein [Pseudolysinimonas sp.]|uniref:DUF7927 domain-containing protein n=1 Tax=Pseudolysinimonas sp. TaxID=2680009 RepID=UPI00326643B1
MGTNVSPNTTSYGTASGNVYYAYVKAGEWVHSWGNGGTATQTRANGTAVAGGVTGAFSAPRQVAPAEAGVWTFAFGGSSAWAVTVYTGNPGFGQGVDPRTRTLPVGVSEITGRVWTEQYSIVQSGGNTTLKTLTFWMLNDSGYLYELTLGGYNGINSAITANSLGVPAGTAGGQECTPSYRSWNGPTIDSSCADPYRLFFEPPAADLPVSAPVAPTAANGGRTTQVIRPAPVDVDSFQVDDFTFTPSTPGSAAGTFGYDLGGFIGGHLLRIDTNGNGVFDDPVDREVRVGAQGEPVEFQFDGLDGEGDPIAACTPMNAQVYFDRIGEVHVIQTDVEARSGISIVRQNGPGAPDATIYWDDTQTAARSNTVNPPYTANGTAGFDSTAGVHGWNYSTSSWGNDKFIDDWTYVPVDRAMASLAVPGQCLEVTKTSDAVAGNALPGQTVQYTVSATNTGSEPFTVADPAYVVDDLTGVLDDADFDADATAEVAGVAVADPVYDAPRLVWSGALEPGETVEITYSVEITGNGDGVVRNVAFASPPKVPPGDVDTPVCADGHFDEVVGVFCATESFGLPRLLVEKTSSRSSIPAVGERVSYTVTATNAGSGDFTTAAPAFVIDDLTAVLDDATLVVGTPAANRVGDLTIVGDRIVWSGALPAGASVVVTYEVEYTGAGDNILRNVAFGTPDDSDPTPTCDPRTAGGLDAVTGLPCDLNRIPGANLTVVKTVDPASGTNVESGQQLTYTLTFTNNGAADATIDHTDLLAGVLDDATVGTIVSPVLTAGPITGDELPISGTLAAGDSTTVSYTVTVRDFADRGDSILANFVVLDGGTPPGSCVAGSETCTVNYVPELRIVKTSDPAAGTAVQSGDQVGYRVEVSNVGAGTIAVNLVDDLTGVLDDATIVTGPASQTLATSLVAGRLGITGSLSGGQSDAIVYTVQINPDSEHGDNVLGNFVLEPGQQLPADCLPGDPTCTTHPVGELLATKTSDPASGSAVETGETIEYMLTFASVGTAPYGVSKVDDLSGVLDDADLTTPPVTAAGLLATTGPGPDGRLEISGALAAGADETVTYAVTIRPDGSRGDDALGNWLLDPGQTVPTGACSPSPGAELCTLHLVPGTIVARKSVDPATGTEVRLGARLTYTLTFTNPSANSATLEYVDRLDGILDDADVVAEPTSSDRSTTVTRSGAVVEVSGAVAAGATVTVTYAVRVRESGRGDNVLANFLMPSGTTFDPATASCATTDPLCTTNEVDPSGLANTGWTVPLGGIIAAFAVLGLGFGLTVTRRRRAI